MKIFIPLAFAFAVALGLILVPPIQTINSIDINLTSGHPAGPTSIPGEYIVFLEPSFVGENETTGDIGVSNSTLKKQEQMTVIAADRVEQEIEAQGGNVTSIYTRAFNGFAIEGVEDVTPLLQNNAIDSIEPNWNNFPDAQYLDNGQNRLDIDRAVTASSRPDNRESRPNIDIAVIDTPVDPDHPDLIVVQRVNFISGCGSTITCFPSTGGPHGTEVAGSCCAKDNLGGVVGGLPGARIHSLGVCAPSGCPSDAILASWEWIISHASTIEIATMSLGSQAKVSSAIETAGQNVINAGVTMFTSAGNENIETINDNFCGVDAFICVSAMSDTNGKCGGGGPAGPSFTAGGVAQDDRRAPFSNHGADVDIMAPGVSLLSTVPESAPETIVIDSAPTAQYPSGAPYIGNSDQGKYTANWHGTSAGCAYGGWHWSTHKVQESIFHTCTDKEYPASRCISTDTGL